MELSIKAPQTPRKSASLEFSSHNQPQTPSRNQPSIHETLATLQQTPLKSIIQSAKKTGLPASPMRVPFALSPLINKNKAAVTPSQPIRDAFLEFPELTNKRVHESEDSGSSEPEDVIMGSPSPRKQVRSVNDSSVHATVVAEHDFADLLSDPKDPLQRSPAALLDCQTSKGELYESVFEMGDERANEVMEDNQDEMMNDKREDEVMQSNHEVSNNQNESLRFPQTFSNDSIDNHHQPTQSSSSHSHSQSKSFSSSTSSNPLLPSGIVKLLEKKRQEPSSHHHQSQQQKPPKKKFDLQESLKRPLPYKPHTGPLQKKP